MYIRLNCVYHLKCTKYSENDFTKPQKTCKIFNTKRDFSIISISLLPLTLVSMFLYFFMSQFCSLSVLRPSDVLPLNMTKPILNRIHSKFTTLQQWLEYELLLLWFNWIWFLLVDFFWLFNFPIFHFAIRRVGKMCYWIKE